MAVFAYKAHNQQQAVVQGMIAADTLRHARDLLRERGLVVVDVNVQGEASRLWRLPMLSRSHSGQLPIAIRELATLLSVGIPLVEALDTVSRQHKGGFQTSLILLKDRVTSGATLAKSMGEQPHVFDPLCLYMVEVGENAGNLDHVLDRLADFKEQSLHLKDQVVTALLYPTIVLVASLAVTVFLMTVVVPMLLTNLLDAGRTLPLPTRILKGLSDLLLHYGFWVGLGAAVAAIALSIALRTDRGKRLWHRLLLRLPLIGSMAHKQALARIATVIATLLGSGIVLLRALEIAASSTNNVVLREAIMDCCREIGAGRDLGSSLENAAVFPPMVVQIFSVGQQTGSLEEMLVRLATDYDRQVTTMSSRLTAALEPILILTLAIFVGFILFATVLPILEAGNVL